MNSGSVSHTLLGHSGDVLSVDWSPTNEFMLATGSADRTIRVWDIRRAGALLLLDQYNHADPAINRQYVNHVDLRAKRDVTSHDAGVQCIKWTSDARHLISSGMDKKMRRWDAQTGKNTIVRNSTCNSSKEACKRIQSLIFLPSLPSVRPKVNYSGLGSVYRSTRFAMSTHGDFIYFPSGPHVLQFDTCSGRLHARLQGHFDRVVCCSVNPSTQDVYSAGVDRHILVWTPSEEERNADPDADREDDEQIDAARRREAEAEQHAQREYQLRLVRERHGPLPDEDAWSDDD